jgi:hypothetical protein
MAVSKEQQEIINKMKKAQQKRNEVMQKTGRTARGVDHVEEQSKPSAKQPAKKQPKSVDVEQLEAQVKALRKKVTESEDKNRQSDQAKKYQKEQEALNSIIRNNDDYHFAKKYTISGANGRTKEIVVKMHAPSVSEQGEIQQEYVDLTKGRGDGFVAMARELFLAIAYFRVVGDNVPTWFTDIDNTYRTDVLFQAWEDYQEWLSSFLDRQFQ